tara:strand:+ start:1091 stop:1243 length:153 start_codon:yes stop_codon:yes gene_type:complete
MDWGNINRTPRSLASNRSGKNLGTMGSNKSLNRKMSKTKMALTLNPMGIL